LFGVTYFDTLVDGFAMDDLGNRTGSETQRNTAHTYAVDSLTNRYTAIDAAPIVHDPAGNLTRDRQNYRYEYDYENRIARIYKHNPDISQEFCFGRPFCPAAAFWRQNVLSVFSNTPGGPFRPAALRQAKTARPKESAHWRRHYCYCKAHSEPE
jgi:hypothetical protein